jgi:hypothetical protein
VIRPPHWNEHLGPTEIVHRPSQRPILATAALAASVIAALLFLRAHTPAGAPLPPGTATTHDPLTVATPTPREMAARRTTGAERSRPIASDARAQAMASAPTAR